MRPRRWQGLLIPPLTPHGYASDRRALQVTFKFHLHPRYWLRFDEPLGPVSFPLSLDQVTRKAHELAEASPFEHRQYVVALATLCLLHCLEHRGGEPQLRDIDDTWGRRIRSILEMIAAAPYDPWTVADLARRCHATPDHFCRRFTDFVGRPPQRFVLEFRMRTAATEILSGSSIKQVAHGAGYSTVHGFTRAFKNVFGQSPAAYVKSLPQRS